MMTFATMTYQERVDDFLAQKRIAVSGLSRSKDSGAGAIYLKLRDKGYRVFALHPEAEALHGDPCYSHLRDIPGGVDAVFIMNSPDVSAQVADEAAAMGIKRLWMHNNTVMPSSVSKEAVERCKDADINVIDVGCPMMFVEPDVFHACMRWWVRATGKMK
jgi:uncharacterized protein